MEKKKRGSRKRMDETQEIIDLKKPGNFIMVGFGASAGGFKPLMDLFKHIPADSGMAYTVILHLSPTHKSNLAELLQKETTMPVIQVQDPIKVEPNHVYVIPPSKNLELTDGIIQLTEPEPTRGQRVSIDLFFRSLAEVYRNNAIAVVLSGAGADGMLGMRRIKEEGGLTIVQDPREAEQADMPRSAIQAGVVDFVLSVKEIPDKLMALRQNAEQIVLPPADTPPREKTTDPLREVLAFVRARSGHDFSNYKRSTILRRIERRLQVNEIKDVPSYLNFMREHQDEVQALLRDLLISVTNFFRDREAFDHLKREVIPRIFEGKEGDDQLRVWVTGCATGEEAYSLAILLSEQAAHLSNPPKIQIFATDIDEDAIARARHAVYPDTIVADVSLERLKQFFIREGDHYRIRKDVREMVLFAAHNILRDPPFSRLDLVTCRNLMIYLTREIQERVLEIFNFSLRLEGFLFLGSSESAEGTRALFAPFDKKFRIYRKRAVVSAVQNIPMMPQSGRWEVRPGSAGVGATVAKPMSFTDLHRKILIERHTPPSILVNEEGEIIHISGDAGRYLRFTEGEPSRSLLKVIHPSLRLEVRAALFDVKQSGGRGESRFVRLHLNGDAPLIKVIAEPVAVEGEAAGFLVIVFEEVKEVAAPAGEAAARPRPEDGGLEPVVRQMEDELQNTRDQLRSTIEQYETSVEELRASNEELQAINEELRSTTEELETSKEELQSVNEELTTVNNELKEKVDEISRANSDLQNLMASTEIGTIFLDRTLQIKRFTPRVQELFNVISSDINRPLEHLTHKLDYTTLAADAKQVLQSLRTIEREVVSGDGRWFIVRLLPYRTLEDRIDGVVVTFIDITERRRFIEELEDARVGLEGRVNERTAELSAEVRERSRAESERTQIIRQMVTALEDERRRISRELHDQLGQQLTGLKLSLENMLAQSDKVALRQLIEQAQATVKAIDADLDFLAWELRPTALDDLGLAAALSNFVQEWGVHVGINAEFQATGLDKRRLPPEAESMLYRITQEALNNISKHAQATAIQVMLERRGEQVALIIEDNGIGFDITQMLAEDAKRRLGLINMRERASFIGGTFDMESEPGKGTVIYVRVPFVHPG